ncbi:phosphatase PAP2 family protein [Ignicoccus islandicus]|uniref:phosphatase PAP2 family protein n=1 Tax=Ignicoccus islandicus TaxID=54259 RepID=UPI0012EDA2AB|nr:phosphatase PAP2 family protein [Ignicoccus islandicus]
MNWKLALAIALIFALAPFSSSIPCFDVGAKGLAKLISITQSLPFFVVWTALIAYKRKSEWKEVVLEAIALNLAVFALKECLMRPRPPGSTSFSYGYPSGHSARAMWVALHLSELYPSLRPALFAYAIAVGWSRVELCEHFPLDVLGGYLVAYSIRKAFPLLRSRLVVNGVRNENNTNR